MSIRKLPLQLLATLALGYGIAAATGAPVPWHAPDAGALRLSWSAHPERIESCRERTAEELASRPAHMRQDLDCTGAAATYLLMVRLDGELLDSAVVRGSGVRNDRPIFLFREYPLPPGTHQLVVTFARREQPDSARSGLSGSDDLVVPSRNNARAIAPYLELAVPFSAQPGAVSLVTLQEGALALVRR